MFRAAGESEGVLREKRLALAEKLLARAKALGPRVLEKKSRRRRLQPISEAERDRSPWKIVDQSDVTFDDVAGLEEVKEQIRMRMVYPYTHPELADRYGIQRGGGILLYGPPGTGKTLLARAVAGEIDAAFFSAKGSEGELV